MVRTGVHMKLLRKKPEKREKILFWVLLVAISITALKSFVWTDIQTIRIIKSKIELEKESSSNLPASKNIQKKWVGTTDAVREAPERLLSSCEHLGIKVIKNRFSPVMFDQDREKREVSLVVEGDYYALERYLNYLENMPAPLVVHTFSIQKSATDEDALSLEISGEFYGAN